MKFEVILMIFYLLFNVSVSWKIFHKGRHIGGNLGEPFAQDTKYSLPSEEWFIQTLNHFDPTDIRTWKQRYYTNDSFYHPSKGGPVFLMIGGEGEATAKWMVEGAWIDYAQKFGALCFQLEHRFYGKSRPTPNLSTKNLQYLSSEQALADLSTFIEAMNHKYDTGNCKWILFGGSYPGSLAAWMRLKYPHLVSGAMSASGPLLAKVDFKEYFQVVEDSLKTYGYGCVEAIRNGTLQVEILLKHPLGKRSLNDKFKLCDLIEKADSKDISNLFETLSGNFAGVVQYNKDNRMGKNPKVALITIDTVCDIMTNDSIGPQVDRLAAVNSLLLETYDQKCLDYKYDKMIEENRNISWESETAEGGRQWTYQTCTEFGFYQTSSQKIDLFGDRFPVDFFIQQCIDIFGYKAAFLDEAVKRSNIFYGALDIQVSNVVFVHGSIDPWHALGITKTVEDRAPAIYIEGTAHCANMYPKSRKDSPELKAARVQIEQLIDTWIRLG